MLDRRTRRDADVTHLSPAEFFGEPFNRLARRHGPMVARGMDALGAKRLTIEVGSDAWTIGRDGDGIGLTTSDSDATAIVTLTDEQFSLWAQQQLSFNGMVVAQSLPTRNAAQLDVSIWDSLSLTLLEGWPTVDEDISFLDRVGHPLDLHRSFTPDDDPADVAHFLDEAGYLRLKGWADRSDMEAISADIDRALPHYEPTDGKSWWATLRDGSLVCVRLQEFLEHSPTTVALLSSERWDQLRRTVGGEVDLVQGPVEGRCIEALIKPVGVASGPSDLTFHRDCHLGRHAYGCSSLTVGVSVTGSDSTNGQLRVVAGSHRVAMPVEIAKSDPYLPVVAFTTEPGDLTVHLSCTLHEATPPVHAPRKVMYTGFHLQPLPDAGPARSQLLSDLREQVHVIHRNTPR